MKIEIETKFNKGDKVKVNKGTYGGKVFPVNYISVTYDQKTNSTVEFVCVGPGNLYFRAHEVELYIPKKFYVHYVENCDSIEAISKTVYYVSMMDAIKAVQSHQEATGLEKNMLYQIGYDKFQE